MLNRYFETDPTNQTDQVALLARMALRRLLPVGEGPIRGYYSQPGAFESASFTVSGDELYRIDTNDHPDPHCRGHLRDRNAQPRQHGGDR